jgi:hypothetical protein
MAEGENIDTYITGQLAMINTFHKTKSYGEAYKAGVDSYENYGIIKFTNNNFSI